MEPLVLEVTQQWTVMTNSGYVFCDNVRRLLLYVKFGGTNLFIKFECTRAARIFTLLRASAPSGDMNLAESKVLASMNHVDISLESVTFAFLSSFFFEVT